MSFGVLRGCILPACVISLAVAVAGAAPTVLPARLEEYITRVAKLTPAQRSELLGGQPVTKVLPGDPSREVSIFGAVWVKAPIASYVALVKNIEEFEKGDNFLVTKKISSPPKLEDFAGLRLPADDVDDARTCKVGSCELKLSAAALGRMRKELDWSKPTVKEDAERLARQMMLEFVNGYLDGGNKRLATYRDSDRPTFVDREIRELIDSMPTLTEFLPEVRHYLLDYPNATLPNSTSFLYWQEANFGLKPTIRINHLVVMEAPTHTVVASKMLYASHYFWTAVELRALVPDPARGQGFWLMSVNQSRSDGLSGFVGRIIRGKVRGEAEKGMMAALRATKTRLEQH